MDTMRYGLCCIVLSLQEDTPPSKFQTMTYASFSRMERSKALDVLGSRILNNMEVTLKAVMFCSSRGYCYRLSSDLFPLLTYEKAGVSLDDLPQKDRIYETISDIASYLSRNQVRISSHPDQFNVLASENKESVDKTVRELNFHSWFMDMLGLKADFDSPINIHLNNNRGSRGDVVERFMRNLDRLDSNCRDRLVLENDDKTSCWSVRLLIDHYHKRTGRPITFDFLHHKCHSDGIPESEAVSMCHSTWGSFTPLFHFSESRDEKNPKAHADYPSHKPNNHGFDFDMDFEFKMKDKAISYYEENLDVQQVAEGR
jgi:UV DNA damage endonuclease